MRRTEGKQELRDNEQVLASIRLEFFRHDERIKSEDSNLDSTTRLTPEGRVRARERGLEKSPNPEVALAYGSPKDRSLETALRQMTANDQRMSGASFEEMLQLIDAEINVGAEARTKLRKSIQISELDFNWAGSEEFKKTAYDRYNKKKDALKFLYEESDTLVRKLQDKKSTSYTRQAGEVASLIKKYLEILPNWQRIAQNNPEKYEKFHNELQRFLGSHQTVPESFLMKLIDKMEGRQGVERFIESLSDKNGFGFSEGFTVELKALPSGTRIVIKLKDKQWDVDPKIIDEIVEENRAFDASFKERMD